MASGSLRIALDFGEYRGWMSLFSVIFLFFFYFFTCLFVCLKDEIQWIY